MFEHQEPPIFYNKLMYHALDSRHIRLLRILPGLPLEPLRCELICASLEACPSYTAVSYAWGCTAAFGVVRVNDQELWARKNLWNFMHQIRSSSDSDPDTYYWIDAISINQEDIQERGHQVNMMRDIFTKATSVDVWLGLADESTSTAFARFLDGPGRFGGKWNDSSHRGHYDFRFFRSELEWEALTALFSRPYWKRAWIVQEYILATKVTLRCGKYFAESESLDALSSALNRSRVTFSHEDSTKFTKSPGWAIHKLRVARVKEMTSGTDPSISKFTLRRLLVAHHSAQCTQLLDRVFAFLGLCVDSDSYHHGIVADYSKNNIDLLVEIIGYCCTWNERKSIRSNFEFIRLMKESLELAGGKGDDAITNYVTNKYLDLQRWLHIIVGSKYFYTTLRRVGQIGRVEQYKHEVSSNFVAATIHSSGQNPPPCLIYERTSKSEKPITLDVSFSSLDPDQKLPFLAKDFSDLHLFLQRVPGCSLIPAAHSDTMKINEWVCQTNDNGQCVAYSSGALQKGDWICAAAPTSRSALVVRNLTVHDIYASEYKVVGVCALRPPDNYNYVMMDKGKEICFFFSTIDLPMFVETGLLSPEQVHQTTGLQLREWTSSKGGGNVGAPSDIETERENRTRLKRGATPPSTSTWMPPDFVGSFEPGGPSPMGGGHGFRGQTLGPSSSLAAW